MNKTKSKKIIKITLISLSVVATLIFLVAVLFMIRFISIIYSPTNQENDENNTINNKLTNVDAVIDSVDDGLSAGVRTCTNGDEYLYIDGASIYLVDKKGDVEEYTAEHVDEDGDVIGAISFNDRYIFYYQKGKGMYMIDRSDKTESQFENFIALAGISAEDDKVYIFEKGALGSVAEIGSGEKVDILGEEDEDKDKDEYVYEHEAVDYYVFLDEQEIEVKGRFPGDLTDDSWLDGTHPIITPARTAVVGNDIYMVAQSTYNHVIHPHLFMQGVGSYDKEALVRYNPQSDKTEVIYLIEDNDEQIVNFSAKDNKLYIYSGNEIFISDLNGENKTKLCDAPEVEKMYFEYVNDQLLIYDENNNLLEMY